MQEEYSEEDIIKILQENGYQKEKGPDYLGSFTVGFPSYALFWKYYSCNCAIRIGITNFPIKPLDRVTFYIATSEGMSWGEVLVDTCDNFLEVIKYIELAAQNNDYRRLC